VTSNLKAFNKAVTDFSKKFVPEQVVLLQRVIAAEMLRRVVLRTPVDTGRARGSWQLSIGAPPSGDRKKIDKAGGGTIAAGLTKLASLPVFSVVFLATNLNYMKVLDQGGFVPLSPGPSSDKRKGRKGRVLVSGGYSVQAPRGILDVSLEETRTQFP